MPLAPGPRGPARLAAALAALLALVLSVTVEAQEIETPPASWLSKISWSVGPSLTRLHFHGSWGFRPEVERTGPTRLRVDLRGVGAGQTPPELRVGSPEVLSVQRVPAGAHGLLPPGVSERFLILLARPDVEWNVEPTGDGFLLLVGAGELTGRPVPTAKVSGIAAYIPEAVGPREVLPDEGELLDPVQPFRVGEDSVVRAGPSGLHAEIARLPKGAVKVAEARRGGWLHLRGGGWMRHALGASTAAGRGTDLRLRRTPVAWNVVTIVPVLNIQVEEVVPGRDPQADVVASYFREPLRVARFTVLASGQSAFSFRFPPRADRMLLKMKSGRQLGSLDPMAEPRRAGVTLEQMEELFPSPQISTGQGFSGWLVFPADTDFLAVDEARIDVAGRIHLLFHVPGSGEMVEQ